MVKSIALAILIFVTAQHVMAAETAPHGGILLEIGDELGHVELIHDAKAGKLTVYVLDGKARNSVAIKGVPKIELTANNETKHLAVSATDEKNGKASQFEAKDESLKVSKLKGKISLEYKNNPYVLDMENIDEK